MGGSFVEKMEQLISDLDQLGFSIPAAYVATAVDVLKSEMERREEAQNGGRRRDRKPS